MNATSDGTGQLDAAFPARVDGVFVATTALAQRLDLLRHLIEFSDLLLLVAGPHGAGKSAFIAELLRQPGERWRVCEVAAPDGTDADALLELILAGYGLRCGHHDNREQRVRLLETHLENQQRHGLVSLIVIDGVERLSADALALACELAGRFEGVRPRLLLAGDSDILVPLAAPGSPSATFTHLLELPAFSPAEAYSYVQARLKAGGLPADVLPEAPLRDRLAALPLLPGHVNAALREEAARIGPKPAASGHRPGTRPRPGWTPVLLVLGGAIGLTLLLYPAPEEPTAPAVTGETVLPAASVDGTTDLAAGSTESTDLAEQVVSEMPGRAAADTAAQIADANGESAVQDSTEPPVVVAPTLPATTRADATPVSPAMPQLPPLPELPAVDEALVATPTAESVVEPDAEVAAPGLQAADVTMDAVPTVVAAPAGGNGDGLAGTRMQTDAVQAAVGTAPAATPEEVVPPLVSTPAETGGETDTEADVVPAEAAPSVAALPPAGDAGSATAAEGTDPPAIASAPAPTSPADAEADVARPEPAPPRGGTLAWLRAQPGGNFTIQLTGSQNLAAAERFVQRHRLGGRAVVVRTRRGATDWFIVVNGSYASRDAARAAIGKLNAALRRDSPWLRPIAEVLSLAVP